MIDLPEIVNAFVVGFDELPEVVEGLRSARVYIGELIGVEVDP